MSRVRVYAALVPFQAHMVRIALEAEGIPAEVHNENLAPYAGIGAEVWVERRHAFLARRLIEDLERSSGDGPATGSPRS
ncbi:MAG: DUF2007 domain-containing protein [Myxococcota bacterium]